MRLILYKPFTLSSAETLASVRVAVGAYEAVKVANHFRGGVAWLVLADTDIGASFQWLRILSGEHPDIIHLCET